MSKYLIHTVDLYIPKLMLNEATNKLIKTTTKKNNLKKVDKKYILNIYTDDDIQDPYLDLKNVIKGEVKLKEKPIRISKKNENLKSMLTNDFNKIFDDLMIGIYDKKHPLYNMDQTNNNFKNNILKENILQRYFKYLNDIYRYYESKNKVDKMTSINKDIAYYEKEDKYQSKKGILTDQDANMIRDISDLKYRL